MEEEKKTLDGKTVLDFAKKNVVWIAVAAVALVIVCLLGCALLSTDRFQRKEDYKNVYFQLDDDVIGNVKGATIKCKEDISYVSYSSDNTLTAVMDEDHTLWIVKGKELVEVDDEVDNFRISAYGDTIAYIKDAELMKGELFLYTVSNGKSVELSSKAYYDGHISVVLSPDGKSVAFMEIDKKGQTVLMVSKNGKEAEEYEDSAIAYGISDNAKYVYYIKDGEKLYVNDAKLDSSGWIRSMVFNVDYTEVLYTVGNEVKYYNVKDKEPVEIDNGTVYGVICPEGTVTASYRGEYFGIDSFTKCVINIDGGLYYFHDAKKKPEKIVSGCDDYQMSEDGKSLLVLDNGKLIHVKNIANPDKAEKHKKLDVIRVRASKDLKDIYFINEDRELCYLKKDEGVVIEKNIYSLTYSDDYGMIYFLDDDELCCAKKTKNSVKEITDDVTNLRKSDHYVIFTIDDEETCVITGKNKYQTLED